MKKLFFVNIICMLLTGITSFAQLSPPAPPKSRPVKVLVSPGLESTPTRTTPLPAVTSYWLTSAKVKIKTGSDNKESLSNLAIELSVRDTAYCIFAQNNVTNELKVNSENTIGLEKTYSCTTRYSPNNLSAPYGTSPTGTKNIQYSDVEKYGVSLRIIYKPNFFADAWKIENVSITLEFRDTNNNLHSSGQKTIVFGNAATFLDNFDKKILVCTADNTFSPLTSFVTTDFSKRW